MKLVFPCRGPQGVLMALLALAGVLAGAPGLAQVPPPHVHVSFDGGFATDGKEPEVTLTPPYEELPAECKVEGVRGKGIIPIRTLSLRGPRLVPAPEGTLSVWVKPLGWAQGKPVGLFARTILGDERESAECLLYQYLKNTFWYESWGGVQMYGGVPWEAWQDNQWRMLTVVWRNGERQIYFDDHLAGEGKDVVRNFTRSGAALDLHEGSKVIDELTLWDVPLSRGQVAMLFYGRRPEVPPAPCRQVVPAAANAPKVDGRVAPGEWGNAAALPLARESLAGSAVAPTDTLRVTHAGGRLYVLYRQPMPAEYQAVKTRLGGAMLKRSVQAHDGPVWEDDSLEVLLSPDAGKTHYRFGIGAAGARYDDRNGAAAFDSSAWRVAQHEGTDFWTIELSFDVKALTVEGREEPRGQNGSPPPGSSGSSVVKELRLNVIRTVRQAGFARRQWSYVPGDLRGYGRLVLAGSNAGRASARLRWDESLGTLSAGVDGHTAGPVDVEVAVTPLLHRALYPQDSLVNAMIERAERGPAPARTRLRRRIAPGPQGALAWSSRLSYASEKAALAQATVRDARGQVLSTCSALLSARRLLTLSLLSLPGRGRVIALIKLPSQGAVRPGLGARVALHVGGKRFAAASVAQIRGVATEVPLDVRKLPAGPFEVRAELTSGGQVVARAERKSLKTVPPPWANSNVGVLKSVPAPWTPVTVQGGTVGVWGRAYTFERSLLPSQVRVLGEDLLAGPMRLRVRSGATVLDTAAADRMTLRAGQAGLKATLDGAAGAGPLDMSLAADVEFDGLAWFTLTLKPRGKQRVDGVTLEVPFRKRYAVLVDDSAYNMFGTVSGKLPPEGARWPGKGTLRVGDSVRGIQLTSLFEVTPADRLARETQTPVVFEPDGDTMRMTYTLSDRPVELSRPVTIAFGIIATPVRPPDPALRKTFHGGHPKLRPRMAAIAPRGYSSALYWDATWTGINEGRYYHFTDGFRRKLAESYRPQWQSAREYSALYLSPTMIDVTAPEYAAYQDEWRIVPTTAHDDLEEYLRPLDRYQGADKHLPGKRFALACWGSKSFQDYYFWSLDKVLASYAKAGVRAGVYIDNTDGYGCANPYHGHGFVDGDGLRKPRFPYRDCRRFVQRLWQVTKRHDPEALVVIHQSGFRDMGIWSMADTLVEGEQYTSNWRGHIAGDPTKTDNDCYPTVLPLDRVRASYGRGTWGPAHIFLTQFWADDRQKETEYSKEHDRPAPSYERRYRHLSGLMRVHDTPLWGEIAPEDAWFKMVAWGYDESVVFVPYYDTRGMLDLDAPAGVVASAWYRPDGKLLVLVFNDTDAHVPAALALRPERFPVKLLPFATATDLSTPDPLLPGCEQEARYPVADGRVRLTLRRRDYALLRFDP